MRVPRKRAKLAREYEAATKEAWMTATFVLLAELGGGSVTIPAATTERIKRLDEIRERYTFHIIDDLPNGTRTVEVRPK